MSTFQPQIFQFFENLPSVPLKEISKHLEPIDIVALSALSPEFCLMMKSKNLSFLKITQVITQEKSRVEVAQRFGKRVLERDIDKRNDKNYLFKLTKPPKIAATMFLCYYHLELKGINMEELISSDFESAKIDNDKYTEKDYNLFFKSWMNGANRNLMDVEFQVDENLKMDQVLKDLNEEKWDRSKRDGWFPKTDNIGLITDCLHFEEGHDIITTKNLLASIVKSDESLRFHVWHRRFVLDSLEKELIKDMHKANRSADMGGPIWHMKLVVEYLESLRIFKDDPDLEFQDFPEEPDFSAPCYQRFFEPTKEF